MASVSSPSFSVLGIPFSSGADGINAAKLAEPARFQRALTLQLGLGLDRETRPRDGLQASTRNGLGRELANTIGLFLDALERLLDFINGILVRRQEAQREIAVKIIGAGIGHVQAVACQFLGGFLGEAVHLPDQLLAQFKQMQIELLPLRLDFFQVRTRTHLGHRTAKNRRSG